MSSKFGFFNCVSVLKNLYLLIGLSVGLILPFINEARTHDIIEQVKTRTSKPQFGTNLNRIADWSPQFPFLDLMKQARPWINSAQGNNSQFKTDENDWVLELDEEQVATSYFYVRGQTDPDYLKTAHVFFDGEGILALRGGKTIESSIGYRLISLDVGNHAVHIRKTNPLNPIRNIRIVPDRFLAAYNRGDIFNPDFLQKMHGMAGLRFMDWMRTNGSEQRFWENRPKRAHRTWRELGVPLEVMIQLANTLNTSPWFNIPHRADLVYIRHFARAVYSGLDPNLNVYIEHSNEVWNKQFPQAIYANTAFEPTIMGSRYDKSDRLSMQWHSKRTAQICDVFKNDIFTLTRERVKCVLGMQTVNFYNVERILECPAFAKNGLPCFEQGFDYIGITSYFYGHLTGSYSYPELNETLAKWASNPDKYLDVAIEQLLSGEPFRDFEYLENYQGAIKTLEQNLVAWKEIADKYGLGLIAYEGGQHINAQHHDLRESAQFVDFLALVNKHPKMEQLYLQVGHLWQAHGDGLHMFFTDIGRQSKWGYWGALEHVAQAHSAKWNAIQKLVTEQLSQAQAKEQILKQDKPKIEVR